MLNGKIIVDSVWDFMVRVFGLLSFLRGELKTKAITSGNESPLELTGNITGILKTKPASILSVLEITKGLQKYLSSPWTWVLHIYNPGLWEKL